MKNRTKSIIKGTGATGALAGLIALGASFDNANRLLDKALQENKEMEEALEQLQRENEQLLAENGTADKTIERLKEIGNSSADDNLKERLYAVSYDLKQWKKKHALSLDLLKKVNAMNADQRGILNVLEDEVGKLQREWDIVKHKTSEALLALAGELDENDENRKALEQLLENSKARVIGEKQEVHLPATERMVNAGEGGGSANGIPYDHTCDENDIHCNLQWRLAQEGFDGTEDTDEDEDEDEDNGSLGIEWSTSDYGHKHECDPNEILCDLNLNMGGDEEDDEDEFIEESWDFDDSTMFRPGLRDYPEVLGDWTMVGVTGPDRFKGSEGDKN